ncbi:leucine-rich repeat domain-containing protein [Flammeovirga pacifica]|nr:leucine-rich repeat domain-containing protein [Flammeovirga pacifica]
MNEEEVIKQLYKKYYPNESSVSKVRYDMDDDENHVISVTIENASDLTEFPEELLAFKKLEQITIRDCNIEEIPEFITEFDSLKILTVYGNPVKEIPEFIVNCKNLKQLDVENTEVSVLPDFLEEIDLIGIYIKGSQITGFPKVLYKFKDLRILTISNDELPSDIGSFKLKVLCAELKSFKYIDQLEKLIELDLSNSTAKYLPENFGNLQKLEDLNLANCKNLVKLPHSIGNINRFWGITLSGCSRLTALPSSMNKIHIGALDLNRCYNLKSVPKGMMVGAITARETKWKAMPSGIFYSTCHNLDVTDHQITDITGIGNMYNLNILNLSRGNIQKIPDGIGRLKELSILIMEHNDIKVIPRALDNCLKLKGVRLYGNPVYDMEALEVF